MLRWPLPALLAWGGCWALFRGLVALGLPAWGALALAAVAGALASAWGATVWRRGLIALGFPLSALLLGGTALPAWAWLAPLAVLLLVYPLNAWRDAPLFPTPADALQGLAAQAPLPPGAHVLDAGCGLGHGLRALRCVYPQTELHGVEWSWPLWLACALRCRWARVRRGDLWHVDWGPYAMVYLFQRPESMPRAAAKACAEMAPGTWLVSLEFAAPDLAPTACVPAPDGRMLWLYRIPPGSQGKVR